jgi:hypothetical protein
MRKGREKIEARQEIEIERSHVGLRGRAVWPISGETVIPASSTIHIPAVYSSSLNSRVLGVSRTLVEM